MYYRQVQYDHAEIPSFNSEKGKKLARQLYNEYRFRKEARSELENEIWPICDDAFACRRDLPKNKTMKWADRSPYGNTDLRDIVLFFADAVSLELIPANEEWLEMYSYKGSDQSRKNRMRDYQSFLHRKADTRSNFAVHFTQVFTRGVGGIAWEWKVVQRLKREGWTDEQIQILALSKQMGVPPAKILAELGMDSSFLTKSRVPYTTFNGPVITPVDMYDCYLDPCTRLGGDDIPFAMMTYKTVDELKNSYDEYGNKIYSNLDGLEALPLQSIYHREPKRYRSLRTLGINPVGYTEGSAGNYVPVLIFHRQVQVLDGSKDKWVDTYFELALGGEGEGFRLIRAYENPSDWGHRCVFFDNYAESIAQTPYHTGLIEKAINAWQYKNVMSALVLQAQLVSVFPPIAYLADVLMDDRKLDVSPGGCNILKRTTSGLSFVAPLEITQGGAMEGLQYEQSYSQKIVSSTGAWGALMDRPDRSPTKGKTATQVNVETTSGIVGRDNILQKFATRTLEPLCQAILAASIQYNQQDIIEFERHVNGNIIGDRLSSEDLDLDWHVTVIGHRAKTNKAEEMDNIQQAYQFMTTTPLAEMDPRLQALSFKVLLEILGRLGVRDLDQFEEPLEEMLMKNPQVQQMLWQMLQEMANGQQQIPDQQGAIDAEYSMAGEEVPLDVAA